jgi:hypothetical protein
MHDGSDSASDDMSGADNTEKDTIEDEDQFEKITPVSDTISETVAEPGGCMRLFTTFTLHC